MAANQNTAGPSKVTRPKAATSPEAAALKAAAPKAAPAKRPDKSLRALLVIVVLAVCAAVVTAGFAIAGPGGLDGAAYSFNGGRLIMKLSGILAFVTRARARVAATGVRVGADDILTNRDADRR